MTATRHPATADAWAVFTRAHALVRDQLERSLLDAHGLALVTFGALAAIDAAPDQRLPMMSVARAVGITKAGATRLADRMEHAGLLIRRRVGCSVYACPTPAGLAALADARTTFARALAAALAHPLDAGQLDALAETCTRLVPADTPTPTPTPEPAR